MDAYILVNDARLNQVAKIDRSGRRGLRGSYAAHMERMEALSSSLNGDAQTETTRRVERGEGSASQEENPALATTSTLEGGASCSQLHDAPSIKRVAKGFVELLFNNGTSDPTDAWRACQNIQSNSFFSNYSHLSIAAYPNAYC